MDVQKKNSISLHSHDNILIIICDDSRCLPQQFALLHDGVEVHKPYLGATCSTGNHTFLCIYVEGLSTNHRPTIELLDANGKHIRKFIASSIKKLTGKTLHQYTLFERGRLWRLLFLLAPSKFLFVTDYLIDEMAMTLADDAGDAYTLGSNAGYWRLPWPSNEERQIVPIEVRLNKPNGQIVAVRSEGYVLDQWLHWVSVDIKALPEKDCTGLIRSTNSVCAPFRISQVVALPQPNSKNLNLQECLKLNDDGVLQFASQRLQGLPQADSKVSGAIPPDVTLQPNRIENNRRVTSADLNVTDAAYPYFGRLENLNADRLTGWALSLNAPNAPVRLDVMVDQLKLCEVTTSLKIQAEDGNDSFEKLGGKAGFSINLSEYVTDNIRQKLVGRGKFIITVFIHGTNIELDNSPLTCLANALLDKPIRAAVKDELKTSAMATRYAGNIDSIRGRRITGWVLDNNNTNKRLELEFYLDGQYVGHTTANLWREELRTLASDNPRHGFEFVIPEKHLRHLGSERAILDVCEQATKQTLLSAFNIDGLPRPHPPLTTLIRRQLDKIHEVLKNIESELPQLRYQSTYHIDEYDEYFRQYYTITPAYRRDMREEIAEFRYAPRISIILPVYKPELRILEETILSALNQTYANFELCVVDDGSGDDAIHGLIKQYAVRDSHIRFQVNDRKQGISAASNTALTLATGDYAAFLGHGDILSEDALFCVVKALQDKRHTVLYSDEDRFDEEGNHVLPIFKPDFNYDLLLSNNYIRHFLVVDTAALRGVGGLREEFLGCEDYDLILRLAESYPVPAFFHIPRVLYHGRILDESASQIVLDQRVLLEKIATTVQAHLDRRQVNATVAPEHDILKQHNIFATRVFWPIPENSPLVSIIIPTKDAINLVSSCIASILSNTDYRNYEILLIDHASEHPLSKGYFTSLAAYQNIRVLRYSGAFNWSAINNYAVSQAKGEILVFLNNDTVVLSRNWLTELVSHTVRPDVGAVGAKLLYDDGTIQHAGVILGIGGLADHAFVGEASTAKGYLGRALLTVDMSAVTGACLACRREVFDQVSGFDAVNLKVAFNDVDFCMKITDAGYRIVWTPHALLYHLESKSRGVDDTPEKLKRFCREIRFMEEKWKNKLRVDPFYNPHFECYSPSPFVHLSTKGVREAFLDRRARDSSFQTHHETQPDPIHRQLDRVVKIAKPHRS
jgi:glycosyltransferase involved in cell wall biosynthesis